MTHSHSAPALSDTTARPHWLRRILTALGPLLALLAVVLIFAVWEGSLPRGGRFLQPLNLRTMAVQSTTVGIAALGMTALIIAGAIDLSAGVVVALCSTVLAWGLRENYSPAASLAMALGTGCLTGFLNGFLISTLRLVPFIVTLGTMTIYLGIAKFIADSTTVRPLPEKVPEWLSSLVSTKESALWAGLPAGVWLALLLAVVLSVILSRTVFGRYVFALGSNESTARLCGINVPLYKILVFVFSGFFLSVAGMLHFSRLVSGDPTSGTGLELKVIAAVVIGGGSLNGGRGSVLGTLTGAAMMSVIQNGCTLVHVDNNWQDIIVGSIIVAAVALDQFRQNRLSAT